MDQQTGTPVTDTTEVLRDPAALAELLRQLTPEQQEKFFSRLERAALRRRIQAWGYLCALVVFVAGAIVGLLYWALVQTFSSLMLLTLPVMLAGAILFAFGRWSRSVRDETTEN